MKNKLYHLLVFLIPFFTCTSQVIYVNLNATGLNNGSSWQDAYTDLSSAINSTSSGEIWVSSGTYTPLTDLNSQIPTNPRQCTFKLKPNVAIYGGFSGIETNLNQRDWVNNVTTLSGEISNPDDLTDNLIHVVSCEYVTINANTILDGIKITKGYSSSANSSSSGGGIYVYSTSNNGTFILRNCVIEENYAKGYGGGMYVYQCNPLIENCTFKNNAAYSGGAMNIYFCNATIQNCVFLNNTATGYALHWGEGGGINIESYSSPKINNNIFTNNFAQYKGGSIYNSSNYNLTFVKNTLSGNHSREGGALFLDGTSYLLNNLLFNNTATLNGGAIYLAYSGFGKVINNTIIQNSAGTSGGGLYIYKPNPEIINCIFWNNTSPTGPQIRTYNDVTFWTPSFRYCNIQGGLSSIASYGNAIVYENNLDIDPLFLDVSNNNFRLQSNSLLINAGNSTLFPSSWTATNNQTIYFPTTDLDGNERIVNTIDIGAYEFGSSLNQIQFDNNPFSVYPNPSNGIININSKIDFDSMIVYNVHGIKVFETLSRNGLSAINLSSFSSGLYFINFFVKNKKYTCKVLLE